MKFLNNKPHDMWIGDKKIAPFSVVELDEAVGLERGLTPLEVKSEPAPKEQPKPQLLIDTVPFVHETVQDEEPQEEIIVEKTTKHERKRRK